MSDTEVTPVSTPTAQASPLSTSVGSAVSNPHPASNVVVPVADIALRWDIQLNLFGDNLPIIPSASHVQNGRILYQYKIKITLTQVADGGAVSGKSVKIKSNRGGDVILPDVVSSGADGTAIITLESRSSGDLYLWVENSDITAEHLSISLKDAWYEGTFLITGYHVCNEEDFSGQLANGNGLSSQHRWNFLYKATGVIMQGTGKALNGRYVRFVSMNTTWVLNSNGNRDYIQNPSQVNFAYSDSVLGAFGPVTENHSIAVDRNVIPPRSHVQIDGVGDRYADDRGSAIVGHHVDNFLGAGNAVKQAWIQGEINGTQRRVKYIGG
ncbi:3D domain-containing protein [Paraburkholderia sp. J67]|uniref:3D domain-containing protein n=1 Tax=Paraburkholderia sp. J67 TaxID=2805435 RepID=UPI002ABD4903|nr:3D domain-containing protein [Paraburkholderia sp. J67]